MVMPGILSFPNPVNEVAARLVAGGVVLLVAAFLVTGWTPLLVLLAYGFVARALAGSRFSPLGLLATRIVVPRLPVAPRWVPGPPKRFAQTIGATLSSAALILDTALDRPGAARVVLTVLLGAAAFEAVLGICLGCIVFGRLIRAGLVPDRVCQECADLTAVRFHDDRVIVMDSTDPEQGAT